MLKKLILISIVTVFAFANPIKNIQDLNIYSFEDAFEKKVTIPKNTKKVIVSFDKKGNSIASEYLNKKPKEFLKQQNTIYIGDIHKMPSMITYMFARPKMQKYNFTIYLYNEEGLDKIIPYKDEYITILNFDENGNVIDISTTQDMKEVF